ncbi:MAG: M14 family zinc carboxypeptidase [Promethearchaeota archaeon]
MRKRSAYNVFVITLVGVSFAAPITPLDRGLTEGNPHNSRGFSSSEIAYDYIFIWETYKNVSGDLPGDDILIYGQSLGPFHNYTEQILKYESLEANFPEFVEVFSIGTTFLGNEIYCVKLTDESITTEKDEILIVAQHHAREQITVENSLYFIDKTIDNLINQDAGTLTLLQTREIYIIPSLNIDGSLLISIMPWNRKTVRGLNLTGGERILSDLTSFVLPEIEPRDMDGDGYIRAYYDSAAESTWSYSTYEGVDVNNNSIIGEDVMGGTDPNRNYDYGFGNPTFSSNENGSQIYHGGEPFSENCTRALRDFIDDHAFKTAVSLHSGIQMIYYPYVDYNNAKWESDVETSSTVRTTLQEILGFPAAPMGSSGLFAPWNYFTQPDNRVTICLETYGNSSALVSEYNETLGLSQEQGVWDFFNPAANRVMENSVNIFSGLYYLSALDLSEAGIHGYSLPFFLLIIGLVVIIVKRRNRSPRY